MKVIKGIYKGNLPSKDLESELLEAKERIKVLEVEKKILERDVKKHLAEIQRRKLVTNEILEDHQIYLLEVERVLHLVPSFAKCGYREGDLKYNQDLDQKLNHGEPIERVKNLYKLLEEAIPRYRKHFDAGLKKNQNKVHGTEKEFLQWAETNKDWIIKRLSSGRGAKKHIYLTASESLQISQSSFYDYLKIHFSEK